MLTHGYYFLGRKNGGKVIGKRQMASFDFELIEVLRLKVGWLEMEDVDQEGGSSEHSTVDTHLLDSQKKSTTRKLSSSKEEEEQQQKGKEEMALKLKASSLLEREISKVPQREASLSAGKENEWEEMRTKFEFLTRKKDFLHLLVSYPMKLEAKPFRFSFGNKSFFSIQQDVRRLLASPSNNDVSDKYSNKVSDKIIMQKIKNKLNNTERTLAEFDFDMLAYLPHKEADTTIIRPDESLTRRIEVGLTTRESKSESGGCTIFEEAKVPNEMLELAIDSAIRHVSKCIEVRFKKVGISGSGVEKVAKALKDTWEIKAKCKPVLYVSVSRHHSTKDVRQSIAEQIPGYKEADEIFTDPNILRHYLLLDFFLLVDCTNDGQIDLHDLGIPNCGFVLVLTTRSQKVYEIMDLDLEIRMEDHLLPWELFCRNVGPSLVHSSSTIQQMAARLVKECHGHLLAIVLLVRTLKSVTDIGVWELAINQLASQSSYQQVHGMSLVMVHVLKLIWDQKDITTKCCIKNCTHLQQWSTHSLVLNWIKDDLVETLEEGNVILGELINSFLLEKVGNSYIRMRDETKIVLQELFIPSLFLRQGGLGLTETPKVEKWTNLKEIELMNNKLSELPENPNSPFLQKLFLHNNYDLVEIPELFFEGMPLLRVLDLSYTSIKSLPPSISRLRSLQTFNLRGCALLMELPPQIGVLGNLEIFDLEGTEITYLDGKAQNSGIQIGLNLDSLLVITDSASYLVYHMKLKRDSRRKCLEYINGDGKPTEITEALNHAFVFFLDHHWTIKMLSDFGNENLVKLKFCLLEECNELQTITDGNYKYPSGVVKEPVFESLNYLGIHHMKNLQSIWKGPIENGCLSCLSSLTLRMCPNLTTIFTPSLLNNLSQLEELVVEDCCKIKSLVTQESPNFKSGYVLQRLKRMSLVDLPELVTISGGLIVNPILKSLIVYGCPKLEILYPTEISSTTSKIKGAKEWLEALKWNESKSSNIWPTFEKLGSGQDLMDQLAKDIYSHQLGMDF
ncbi:Disease resistance protein RPS2 [Camellia lanceoleosa]|uniref:Disease resistance protein RPS2 n=1 Tax=Camellia lanceoleosa TaxID=1840588 RepID=A0ACC0IK91_9ERIC|nr:Disease resistance protein RPS2 [Camellia lanceoleosa]